jgi:hypothetical protein
MKSNINEIDTLEKVRNEFNRLVAEKIETHKYNDVLENINTLGLGKIRNLYESISDIMLESDNGIKIMRKYVKTIKENKDLKKVFSFYDFIDKLNVDTDSRWNYINEGLKCLENIDKHSFKMGVKELGNIVSEGVKTSNITRSTIEECINSTNNVYESVDFLILEKPTLKNINERIDAKRVIDSFLDNKTIFIKESCTNDKTNKELISEINEELSEISESWMKELIEDITLNNLSNKDNKILFENYKNDCLMIIENIINNNDEIEDKSKMFSLKEKLGVKEYNADSFNNDIINLAELKSTLKYEN